MNKLSFMVASLIMLYWRFIMKGQVCLYDADMKQIGIEPINKLNYNKRKIIEKSIELFNDSDPCIIHLTFCINTISEGLYEELSNNEKLIERVTSVEALPISIAQVLELDADIKYVRFI